jgi:hypothetical protein
MARSHLKADVGTGDLYGYVIPIKVFIPVEPEPNRQKNVIRTIKLTTIKVENEDGKTIGKIIHAVAISPENMWVLIEFDSDDEVLRGGTKILKH